MSLSHSLRFLKTKKKKRNKGPSTFRLRVQSHHFSLSLRLGLYQHHYPSLVSVTHLVVALIIVFEGAIITGKVAREGFETSETMRSDKDKFPARRLRSHGARLRCVSAEPLQSVPELTLYKLIHPRFKEERILNSVREEGDESWKRWKSYFLSLHFQSSVVFIFMKKIYFDLLHFSTSFCILHPLHLQNKVVAVLFKLLCLA